MEPSRSGDPHDNLIPWQKIKGKEWSHQEIGHAGPPSQRRVGRDAVGYYHERKNEYRNVGVGADHEWSNLRGRPATGPARSGGTGAKIVWTYFLRLRANCLLKWSRVGNCGRAGHGKSSGKAIA
jgi:hypothetical protein